MNLGPISALPNSVLATLLARYPRVASGIVGFSDNLIRQHLVLLARYERQLSSANEDRIGSVQNAVTFHRNFFSSICDGGVPLKLDGLLAHALDRDIGGDGVENLAKIMRGILSATPSGWAVLAWSREQCRLRIARVQQHDRGWPAEHDVILALDAWEHAYAADYGIWRGPYIEALWRVIDWNSVEERFSRVSGFVGDDPENGGTSPTDGSSTGSA